MKITLLIILDYSDVPANPQISHQADLILPQQDRRKSRYSAAFKVKLNIMNSAGVVEFSRDIDPFYQECLELLNEISIEPLLNRIAVVASSVVSASYCICGTINETDQFEKLVLNGFTRIELDLIHQDEMEKGISVQNIQSDISLLIASGKSFPDSYNIFPAKRPQINSLLFVPVFYNAKKIASIILMNKIGPKAFDEADQKSIQILAAYAGISINNTVISDHLAMREQMLAKRNEDLALLNELAKISASSSESLQTIVEDTMQQVMGYLDLDVGELFLQDDTDPQTYNMIFKEGHSLTTSLLGFKTVRIGEGAVGKTALTRKQFLLSKEELKTINQKKATSIDLNYMVIVPLITGSGVLGICCFGTKLVDGAEQPSTQFLNSIASWMAMLIQDFQLTRERKRVAILEERERISMDLHDGVIQSIYGVGLTLEHARLISKSDPEKTEDQIQKSITELNATIRDIRSYIMDLKPARLTNENLVQNLRRLANDFYSNTLVTTKFDPQIEDIDNISADYANTFYMICKEALANITKHAKASQVDINFIEQQNRYLLTIHDNGRGFDPQQNRQVTNHGITNMFARAKNLNGELVMNSTPGKGTLVEVWFPKTKKKR